MATHARMRSSAKCFLHFEIALDKGFGAQSVSSSEAAVASGADVVLSLLLVAAQSFKLWTALGLVLLRGMRESITGVLPIFLGFFVTQVLLILYGIATHVRPVHLFVLPAMTTGGAALHYPLVSGALGDRQHLLVT
jgi:hypothetical protein